MKQKTVNSVLLPALTWSSWKLTSFLSSPKGETVKRSKVLKEYKRPYKENIPYGSSTHINFSRADVGAMPVLCKYCEAKRWRNESPSMCCALGKVCLPPFSPRLSHYCISSQISTLKLSSFVTIFVSTTLSSK